MSRWLRRPWHLCPLPPFLARSLQLWLHGILWAEERRRKRQTQLIDGRADVLTPGRRHRASVDAREREVEERSRRRGICPSPVRNAVATTPETFGVEDTKRIQPGRFRKPLLLRLSDVPFKEKSPCHRDGRTACSGSALRFPQK